MYLGSLFVIGGKLEGDFGECSGDSEGDLGKKCGGESDGDLGE